MCIYIYTCSGRPRRQEVRGEGPGRRRGRLLALQIDGNTEATVSPYPS